MDEINKHISNINKYKKHYNSLINFSKFCEEHNFFEEHRIAEIKIKEITLILDNYENLLDLTIKTKNNGN